MPLVRVTPDNAVDTVRDQVEDFRETIAAAGRSPAFLKLADQADELSEVITAGTLEVELLALEGLHPEWTGALAHWLGVEPEPLARAIRGEEEWSPPPPAAGIALVAVRTDRNPGGRRAGTRVPPILVVAQGTGESPPREMVEEMMAEMRRRPLTLITAPEGSDWARALAGLGSRESWMARFVELPKLAGVTLQQNFEREPWKEAAPLACAWSVTRALGSLQTAFSVLLDKESRSVGAKKAALEQRAAHQGGGPNPNEVLGEARNYLQKRFESFQKRVSGELAELIAPHDGTLTREVDAGVQGLTAFDKEKKPKFDVVTIPTALQENLLARVRQTLAGTLRSQWIRLRETLRDAEAELETLLDRKGAPPVALHFDHLPEQRVETILQRAVQIQKSFRGEITRRGPMDYFMAARRYQMLFFMIFSAFGLSFIRSYREFTIPAGVLLLAFGMLQVVNGARRQRAEAEEKELGKARDTLRGELQRGMVDVQKNWEQAVSNHLARQQAEALEAVETTVKSVADQVSREAAESKDLLQQQMRGLDGSQRKLQEGVRKSEAAAKDLEALSGQLIEFYAGMVHPGEEGGAGGRPGLPGAAGGGRPGAAKAAAGAGGAAAAAAAAAAKAAQERLAALGVGGGKPGAGAGAGGRGAGGDRAGGGRAGGDRGGGSTGSPADLAAGLKKKAEERMKKLQGGGGGGDRGGRGGASAGSPADLAADLKKKAEERMKKLQGGGGDRPGASRAGATGSRSSTPGSDRQPSPSSPAGSRTPRPGAGPGAAAAADRPSRAASSAADGRKGGAGTEKGGGKGDEKGGGDESPAALAQRLKAEAEERLKKLRGAGKGGGKDGGPGGGGRGGGPGGGR